MLTEEIETVQACLTHRNMSRVRVSAVAVNGAV